ncbi:hypothetical protein IU500_12450 [Nocardia terpenica]|uniref:Gp37-like protein n=1 Tax=Nocardia terpenica TaxID=455432 RepID=UPI001895097D|nr:hypothetical protein [Nocardia terpenica]MBF6063012.1 hypothetical protein [Nocardia terpenica]MBF6104853.1 hypothetical protein [Nocardia terpenica]MBF6118581.1 hypothetical protein [Nocardia terpenica]
MPADPGPLINDRLGIVFDPDHIKPGPLDLDVAGQLFDLLTPDPPVGERAQFEIVIYDKFLNPLGEINNYSSAKVEFVWNEVGTGELTIPGDHTFAKLCMSADNTVVPITVTYNGKRWSGRVDVAVRKGIKGRKTIELALIDDYAWFHAILAYPQPLSIPEAQFPPQDVMIAPLRTLIYWYLARNVWRLGLPITLMPYNPLTDTTPWQVGMARMVPLDELFAQWLKDSDCKLDISLWLPGDPQPHPLLYLTRPQYIIQVIDRPKTGGIIDTKTFLDGIADAVGEVIAGFIEAFGGFLIPGLAEAIDGLLRRSEIPWVIWSEDSSGVADAELTVKHPLYYSVVVGGKSPMWVNKLLDLAVELGMNLLFQLLSLATLPGLGTAIASVFHDVFLAFQKFADWAARARLGPLAFPEGFVNTGAAYTFATVQAGNKGLYDGRGQRSAKVQVMDGFPFLAFVDYEVGVVCGWEDDGEIFYDRVHSIGVEDTRTDRVLVSAVIGDDKTNEEPGAKGMRLAKSLTEAVNFLAVN